MCKRIWCSRRPAPWWCETTSSAISPLTIRNSKHLDAVRGKATRRIPAGAPSRFLSIRLMPRLRYRLARPVLSRLRDIWPIAHPALKSLFRGSVGKYLTHRMGVLAVLQKWRFLLAFPLFFTPGCKFTVGIRSWIELRRPRLALFVGCLHRRRGENVRCRKVGMGRALYTSWPSHDFAFGGNRRLPGRPWNLPGSLYAECIQSS